MGQTLHEDNVVLQSFLERLGQLWIADDVVRLPGVMSCNREFERKSAIFVLSGGEGCPNTRVFKLDLLPVELRLKFSRVLAEIVPQSGTYNGKETGEGGGCLCTGTAQPRKISRNVRLVNSEDITRLQIIYSTVDENPEMLDARKDWSGREDLEPPAPMRSVVDLPIHRKIIQTHCNAIQTLLQLNSNNSKKCVICFYTAVVAPRSASQRLAALT